MSDTTRVGWVMIVAPSGNVRLPCDEVERFWSRCLAELLEPSFGAGGELSVVKGLDQVLVQANGFEAVAHAFQTSALEVKYLACRSSDMCHRTQRVRELS